MVAGGGGRKSAYRAVLTVLRFVAVVALVCAPGVFRAALCWFGRPPACLSGTALLPAAEHARQPNSVIAYW